LISLFRHRRGAAAGRTEDPLAPTEPRGRSDAQADGRRPANDTGPQPARPNWPFGWSLVLPESRRTM